MASNSGANLSSDFDIDEVINWDEQNFSSKEIEFQLPQFGLPADVKKTQNTPVTLPSLGSAEATSQDGQSSSAFYSSIFGVANSPSVVTKNHGFSCRPAMVPPSALSFPSGNINIPPLATSNSSMLQFPPNLVGQNSSLRGQLCVPSIQNVEDSNNLINDDVPACDDSDDLILGPLDRIVDQIMERENSERITESPSSSFDDDTPVITFSNRQVPQLSSSGSPQNVPSRNALSPNAPSRNVASPNMQSPNITIRSSPSPNGPTRQVPSPSNPTQNILSTSPPSRNVPVKKTTTTKVIPPSISPPNVRSANIPSPMQHSGSRPFSTMQGLNSQTSEQSMPPQLHSTFRLPSPVSVPSSMVGSLDQTTMNSLNTLNPGSNMPISLGQTDVDSSTLFQASSAQRNNQSFPSFLLQNTNQTLIRHPSITSFSPSYTQSKPVWPQSSGNNLDDLLQIHKKGQTPSPQLDKKDFMNARSSPSFTSVLTSEASQSNVLSFIPANIGSDRSTAMDMNGQNITVSASQFNRNSDSIPKSISDQLHTGISQSISYPGEASNAFSGKNLGSLTGSENDELRITSIGCTIKNPATQPLSSPLTNTSGSIFFAQNSSSVVRSTNNENSGEIIFSNATSQPQNVLASNNQNLTQGQVEAPSLPQQNRSVFTFVPPSTTLSQANSPTLATSPALFKSQSNTMSSKPAGITTIKITSPSANATGSKYSTVGLSPNPTLKAVSIQPSRKVSATVRSPTNVSTTSFPTFKLPQGSFTTVSNACNTRPVVFTLAPGSQSFKGFPANLKDKLTGRQVIILQQPTGQPINTPKPQPMKIVFVNDSSIAQVVSGDPKIQQSSAAPVISTIPGHPVSTKATVPSSESNFVLARSTESVHDSDAGSPSSVNSADSDSIPIAALKQSEALKHKENDSKIETGPKSRGRKRRKDPNRPVKPLSTFQRFFQATQPTVRQQNPQATFTEVSKTIKEMWENISPKNKKVYQDAWRTERAQYKKAMEEYNSAKIETDALDGPSAKQAKHVIEIQDNVSTVNPIPVSQVDTPARIDSSTVTSLSATSASSVISSSSPAPRSSGKPMAMMAEMANKTKLASAQAVAKATAVTKSLHHGKNKASNGIEDIGPHVAKKKTKINPIPKKSCIRSHCNKPAKFTKERGTMFCSNDCLMRYCRGVFRSWVETRRQTLKTAT